MTSNNNHLVLGGTPDNKIILDLTMANRHGLIAGATGTGKTVTLQVLAEGFAKAGVPVFLADVKGDLSGLATAGSPHKKIDERLAKIGLNHFQQRAYPTVFWDLYGIKGHPSRTTVSEFGPLLLASFLGLNDTQTGILYAVFKFADDEGLLLLDFKDLQALVAWVKEHRSELENTYGGLNSASIAAVQRRLMMLDEEEGDLLFGEPALNLTDLLKTDFNGIGVINILDATRLIQQPKLYSIFLLWLISELFEQLPEVGDSDKPKLVFFFDEAHLLFDDAPKILIDKIEQVVRLIRSKGVGIYFVSQSPADIPDDILGQLGNRVQHALRAFTPKDQKTVRVAAQTFRSNPKFATEEVITQLAVGEALVSTLDSKGSPSVVERSLICPPESRIGPLTVEERTMIFARSPFQGRYDTALDRESAYEILLKKAETKAPSVDEKAPKKSGSRQRQGVFEAMAKSAARSIGSSLGRQIVRGILGSILGRK